MVNNTAIDSQSWSVSKSTTRDYGISQNISKMDSVEVSNVGCASPSLVHKNSIVHKKNFTIKFYKRFQVHI